MCLNRGRINRGLKFIGGPFTSVSVLLKMLCELIMLQMRLFDTIAHDGSIVGRPGFAGHTDGLDSVRTGIHLGVDRCRGFLKSRPVARSWLGL